MKRPHMAVACVLSVAGLFAGSAVGLAATAGAALPVSGVSASGDDGNVPENTIDGDLSTRWSDEGDGVWISYDLGAAETVGSVSIAWHRGNTRVQTFDIQLSSDSGTWTTALANKRSSGATSQPENYDFTDTTARYVRVVGHGNTTNDWTSISETAIHGEDSGGGAELPYGTDGNGNPKTDDCTVFVDSDPQAAVDDASSGDVVCVRPADYSGTTLTVDKAITVRANGVVRLRNIVVSGSNAVVDGFTVVGDELDDPSTGIKFSGSGHRIVNNLVNGKHIHYAIACDPESCASDVLVAWNTVTGTNNFGVVLWGGEDIVVERNNIYDLWSDDGNDDVDGMRIWGTGHIIRNNYIHDLNVNKGEGEPHADCLQNYQASGETRESSNVLVENNYCVRVSGQCLIMQNGRRPTADIRGYTYRGNVCESYGWQTIELGSIPGTTIENNILCGGTEGHVLTFHSTVDGLDTTNVRMRNNVLVTAGGSVYSDGSEDALTDDTSNIELTDESIRDDWQEFENNPNAPVPAINPDDFTKFRQRAQAGDILDEGAPPNSANFTTDVDGASRVQGPAIDIGPYEFG